MVSLQTSFPYPIMKQPATPKSQPNLSRLAEHPINENIVFGIEDGGYSWSDIADNLGDVVNGDTPGRTSDTEITLFKSVGLAIQDISCAALVYRQALANGIGQEFNFSA